MQIESTFRITPAHWAMMAQTFIAGTSFSFARTASVEFNPFVLAFLRLTGSALIFGVLFFFARRLQWQPSDVIGMA